MKKKKKKERKGEKSQPILESLVNDNLKQKVCVIIPSRNYKTQVPNCQMLVVIAS